MKRVTLNLSAPTIYQVEAGDQKAIRDGGDLYICIQSEDGMDATEPEPEKTVAKRAVAKVEPEYEEEEEETEEVAQATSGKQHTEAELMNMKTPVLLDMLADVGIDPAKYEGANTNKKLRLLILDNYANGDAKEPEAEVVDDVPVSTARTPRTPRAGATTSNEPVLIPVDEWDGLEADTMVLARLFTEGDAEASEKLWEAQIVGWDTPKGTTTEKLFVLFLEDDTEDFLREEDTLYIYKKQL